MNQKNLKSKMVRVQRLVERQTGARPGICAEFLESKLPNRDAVPLRGSKLRVASRREGVQLLETLRDGGSFPYLYFSRLI